MDQIGEIVLKLRITELGAQLALREIERLGLSRQINDPSFDPGEKERAVLRRERTIIEWGEIMTDLQELRRQERELSVTPHAKLN